MKFNYPLKKLTTIKVGGPAKYFIVAKNEVGLIKAIKWARKSDVKWLVIGQGSNLIPNDKGFNGLIIKNQLDSLEIRENEVIVGAGYPLLKLINKLNGIGLSGLEKMAGIPGTVGGAVYGSAGAYGQEMKDNIVSARIFDGKKSFWLTQKKCKFGYRNSIFKKNKGWIILAVKLKLGKSKPKELLKISREIIKQRSKKYPPDLLCPGSFFKNILIKEIEPINLRNKFLLKIPKDKINHEKVSAGYLLESVGAKSVERGGIKVADYHGNLIYNSGKGKTDDIIKLTKILKNKVQKKFGLVLEEEVQYI